MARWVLISNYLIISITSSSDFSTLSSVHSKLLHNSILSALQHSVSMQFAAMFHPNRFHLLVLNCFNNWRLPFSITIYYVFTLFSHASIYPSIYLSLYRSLTAIHASVSKSNSRNIGQLELQGLLISVLPSEMLHSQRGYWLITCLHAIPHSVLSRCIILSKKRYQLLCNS